MTTQPPRPSRAKQFAAIERISVFGAVARMGPVGLWQYADAYKRAAETLPAPEVPYEPVRYYLACHAIELCLKAYLSVHGATMLDLAENAYGHNLDRLLAAADQRGLSAAIPLPAEHRAEVHKAADYYAGKLFEYPAVGEAIRAYPGLPNIDSLLEVARILVTALAEPCLNAQ